MTNLSYHFTTKTSFVFYQCVFAFISRYFNQPDWKEESEHDREDHLDVRPWCEPEHTEDGEVDQLEAGECVDLPLGHPLDIVVGRVGSLLSEEEKKPLEHLVAVKGSDGHVEEQTVQHSLGDVGENVVEEGQGNTCKFNHNKIPYNLSYYLLNHTDENV